MCSGGVSKAPRMRCCHLRRGGITSSVHQLCRDAPGGLLSLCLQHPTSEATHGLVLASRRLENAGGGMNSNMGEEDEDIPQGDRKDEKTRESRSSRWEGGNYYTVCFLS